LRRTKALHSLQQAANGVIEQVDSKAATAFVQAIDVVAEKKRLEQALNDAFECMLTDANDSPGEQLTCRDRALANLAYRDRLTSIHAALVMTKATDAVKALEQKLAQLDAGLSKKARMLVGLNEARRAELDALDAGERAAAWWFASRSHCDALATIYAGEPRISRAAKTANATLPQRREPTSPRTWTRTACGAKKTALPPRARTRGWTLTRNHAARASARSKPSASP